MYADKRSFRLGCESADYAVAGFQHKQAPGFAVIRSTFK